MSNLQHTKNDKSWNLIFEKYQIVSTVEKNGHFIISASAINQFREARLMTKFDHKNNLPILFKSNKLSILPIARGKYIIAGFNAYCSLMQSETDPVELIKFPTHLQSLDRSNIYSESIAVNCAYVSGMLSHFLEEEDLLPTVNGRMSSGLFDFQIDSYLSGGHFKINVKNSQVEIDGGFEGMNSLALIEAKNNVSSDFIIRQLYYPYRLWNKQISKPVRPIFLVYSNGVFSLHEYKFIDPNNYNSLVLIKHKRYRFEEQDISLEEILTILNERVIIEEPEIPFPQADSFDRVISLCELLYEKKQLSTDEITTTYDFDERQTGYYTNAARYLGLVNKDSTDGITYVLSTLGVKVLSIPYRRRQLKYAELILKHCVFAETLQLYLHKSDSPTKLEVVEIMKKANLYKMRTHGLFLRRSSTILGWVNWILNLQK